MVFVLLVIANVYAEMLTISKFSVGVQGTARQAKASQVVYDGYYARDSRCFADADSDGGTDSGNDTKLHLS